MSLTETDIVMLFEDFSRLFTQESGNKLDWIPNAQDELHGTYDATVKKHILPLLPNSSADRHKRASVLEMCIMHVLPIKNADEKVRLRINADLAFVAAKSIIMQYWFPVDIEETMFRLEPFEENHLQWLKHVSSESYPFVCNAIGWYLFEQIIEERYMRARGHSLQGNPAFK